ncbi:TPA: hypothetical protein ACK3Q6_004474 [Burkholderia cepacia]
MNRDYLLGMFAGVMLASIASTLVRYWRRWREQAKDDAAKKAIESHGFAVFTYLAAAGTEDEKHVVGRIIPKVAHPATEAAKLRLVVDNTKN